MPTKSREVEQTLDLLIELLRPLPLTAPEIEGEVRHRWSTGVWKEDQLTRPLTMPKLGQLHGYGRLYECLQLLHDDGRVECFTGPDETFQPLWRAV